MKRPAALMRMIPFLVLAAAVVHFRSTAGAQQDAAPDAQVTPEAWSVSSDLGPGAVLQIMQRAADWQLAHPSTHAPYEWTQATFYTGVMALADVSGDAKYLAAMRAMGEANQWRPGLRPGHADDYAVIATYARLSQIDKDKKMLAPALALFNFLVSRPYNEPLAWGNRIETRELAWCDALFMGPPALAAVSAQTGDRTYLDLANRLWWKTTDYLYDKDEHLYYRDSRYFEPREPNGRKVFWSRGNGWVIAGLARVLDDMPADYPDRPRYVTLFREMAEKVVSLQGADGYWRSSLLDAASLPNPETSGTGFFAYSLAWGINKGLLDRTRYEPNVRRGWTALVNAIQPDGMLGWVQRIGDKPGATSRETTEVYGVGALLLAGSEVYRLAGGSLPAARMAMPRAAMPQPAGLIVNLEHRSTVSLDGPWHFIVDPYDTGYFDYRHQIGMLKKIDFLRGASPWILMDFRSPRRVLPGVQDNYNRKGLVSEQGAKKKAFFVLKEFYGAMVGKTTGR